MVQLWTEHQGWVKDGLEIVRVKKSGVAIHQLPAFSGYAVNFRRYFYDSSKPRAERSSSKQLRYGAVALLWEAWMQYAVTMALLPKNKGVLPALDLHTAWGQLQAHIKGLDSSKSAAACSSPLKRKADTGADTGTMPMLLDEGEVDTSAGCAGGAANTLGTSSSSSQPAALICSAMLHLTSTAAVLNALIAARQLAAASHATDPPLGLQGPSMNQGPAESEALLAAPAAAAGPSTSFAEELQPAAPDPEFSAVACADQLDCFIAALQAVQDASPSGLVDHNGQPHILLLTGPPAPPATSPAFLRSSHRGVSAAAGAPFPTYAPTQRSPSAPSQPFSAAAAGHMQALMHTPGMTGGCTTEGVIDSSSKKVKRQGAGQEAGGNSMFPVVSLQQPADPWASSAEQPLHHLMVPGPLFAQSTSGGLPVATADGLSQGKAHQHYETAQQQHQGVFLSSFSTGARPAGMECPLTPWAFL